VKWEVFGAVTLTSFRELYMKTSRISLWKSGIITLTVMDSRPKAAL
jgi:hypothetical protein